MNSNIKRPLLVEIGTEELPPKVLKKLAQSFSKSIYDQLLEQQFIDAPSNEQLEAETSYQVYATPRRLAVLIDGVKLQQDEQVIERKGPAISAAFDEQGQPSKAALGFARSVGVDKVDSLDTLETDEGKWLFHQYKKPGETLVASMSGIIEKAMKDLPIPKRMRWGSGDASFIRPVHWFVVMHDDEVIPVSLMGIDSGCLSQGHRFHCDQDVVITSASAYESIMQDKGSVIVDYDKRQQMICDQINEAAKKVSGKVHPNQDLLDEVTGLVELPQAICGHIEAHYMSLPKEVLITSMQDHQKYFAVTNADDELLPYFITVSNIRSKDETRVTKGNERVIRARLADAQFFWDNDKKQSLDQMASRLDQVLFHIKIGLLSDKVKRTSLLAAKIAKLIGADSEQTERAGMLCKADLVSGMVGEFPELQGCMGKYYALQEQQPQVVAEAIQAHYQPRYAGDELPSSKEASALAMADKLDTIVGIFLAGEVPSGDKDPYGLRRNALGILRIIIENEFDLDLNEIIDLSVEQYKDHDLFSQSTQSEPAIKAYVFDRLKMYYQHLDTKIYQAVAEVKPTRPLDFDRRVKAIAAFSETEAAISLSAANKRIRNILEKNKAMDAKLDKSLLTEAAEINLFGIYEDIKGDLKTQSQQGDYALVLSQLAKLKEPIDLFFDEVKVMDDDDAIRENRMGLLHALRGLFLNVADISRLQ